MLSMTLLAAILIRQGDRSDDALYKCPHFTFVAIYKRSEIVR
jgi:hypothetical protein